MYNSLPEGTLCDTQLQALAQDGVLVGYNHSHLQPSSWDLVLGEVFTEISASPNLDGTTTISDFIEEHRLNDLHAGTYGATLSPGSLYITEVPGSVHLPESLIGYMNPKSSLGRVFAGIQVVTEKPTAINHIPPGYKGKLYILVAPHVIRLTVTAGIPAAQLRLRAGARERLRGAKLADLVKEHKVIVSGGLPGSVQEDGLLLHLDLSLSVSNYVAIKTGRTLNLGKRTAVASNYFFTKGLHKDRLYLDPGECVLAASHEMLSIPIHVCGEMVAHDQRYGSLFSHDAGFFDPHFGWHKQSSKRGARAVFEIKNIGSTSIILGHLQPIGSLQLELMSESPSKPYGSTGTNNYQGQSTVRLAKFFADV